MSIRDRISAFERGQPLPVSPVDPTILASSPSPPPSPQDEAVPLADLPREILTASSARHRAGSTASNSSSVFGGVGGGPGFVAGSRAPSAISRTVSNGSLASNASGGGQKTLNGLEPGRRPPPAPPSPRKPKSEILSLYSSPSSSRAVSPTARAAPPPSLSAPTVVKDAPVSVTLSSPTTPTEASPKVPPPLPQRQRTLPAEAPSGRPAPRPPPPIPAKPKSVLSETSQLRLRTNAPRAAPTKNSSDMISFSPVAGTPENGPVGATGPRPTQNGTSHKTAPFTSSMASVELEDTPLTTSSPAPTEEVRSKPPLPRRKSTASSTASFPPPLPARKPTLPSGPPPPSLATRRQPPLPPQRSNTASSTLLSRSRSTASTLSSNPSISRRAASEQAKMRYSALFTQLLAFRRVARIKLVMSGKLDESVAGQGKEDQLPGAVVRRIWDRSGLPAAVLREIWLAVDPERTGSLDRAGFEKGMGLIDDQLARRQRALYRR